MITAAIVAGAVLLLGLVGGGVYLADRVANATAPEPLPVAGRPRAARGEGPRPVDSAQDQGHSPEAADEKAPRLVPKRPPPPTSPEKPHEGPPTAEEAFAALQQQIAEFKADADRKPVWPPDRNTGLVLFPLDQKYAEVLDALVAVGKRPDLTVHPSRADTLAWKWEFNVGNDCLATLELTGGKMVLRRGDAPDEVWTRHETLLRCMPIVFTRPGRPRSTDNLIHAVASTELRLPAGATLHALLCGDAKTVELLCSADAVIEEFAFKAGEIPVKGSPVRLAIVSADADQARLELTTRIGGRAYTLNEPIVLAEQRVGRVRGTWTARTTRFEKSLLNGHKAFSHRDMSIEIPGRNRFLPAIFKSLLEDGFPGRKFSQQTINKYVEAWTGEDKAMGAYIDKLKTFEEVRQILCTYVAEQPEGDDTFAAVQAREYAQENPEPPHPEDTHTPPPRRPEESDAAYEARVATGKREHDRQNTVWEAWRTGRDKAIRDAVEDPVQLRLFFDTYRAGIKPEDAVDPETAAIQILLELDGFLLAKCHRAEIEALLKQVPVAALVEGESRIRWTIDFLGDVSVPARLLPADVLDTPAAATPPDDPLPALPSR